MGLRNRITQESQDLKGVNLSAHETKMKMGTFRRLENWIPGKLIPGRTKIKKKRGVATLTSTAPTGGVVLPGACGFCPAYTAQNLNVILNIPGTGDDFDFDTWLASFANFRMQTGRIAVRDDGDLECWFHTRSGSHQFDSYSDDSVGVFKAIWTTAGSLVSCVETDSPKPGESDVGGQVWRNFPLVVATATGGALHLSEHGFSTSGPAGNPFQVVVYPERNSGAGQGITFNAQGTLAASCFASFGGTSGTFYGAGNDGSGHACIGRWINTHGGSPPLATALGTSIQPFTDGAYTHIFDYLPGEEFSWACATKGSDTFPWILKLDPDDDSVLAAYSGLIGSFAFPDYAGFAVIDDRWVFIAIDNGNASAFQLFVYDTLLGGSWTTIDATITKIGSTTGNSGTHCMHAAKGADNTVYLLWDDRFNEGNKFHFWTPLACP